MKRNKEMKCYTILIKSNYLKNIASIRASRDW